MFTLSLIESLLVYVKALYYIACCICSTIIIPHSTNQIVVFWCRRLLSFLVELPIKSARFTGKLESSFSSAGFFNDRLVHRKRNCGLLWKQILFISDKGYQTEKLTLIYIAHLKKDWLSPAPESELKEPL